MNAVCAAACAKFCGDQPIKLKLHHKEVSWSLYLELWWNRPPAFQHNHQAPCGVDTQQPVTMVTDLNWKTGEGGAIYSS